MGVAYLAVVKMHNSVGAKLAAKHSYIILTTGTIEFSIFIKF